MFLKSNFLKRKSATWKRTVNWPLALIRNPLLIWASILSHKRNAVFHVERVRLADLGFTALPQHKQPREASLALRFM